MTVTAAREEASIITKDGKPMWNDLPLPRTERLPDGREFSISMDPDRFIRIFDNKIAPPLAKGRVAAQGAL